MLTANQLGWWLMTKWFISFSQNTVLSAGTCWDAPVVNKILFSSIFSCSVPFFCFCFCLFTSSLFCQTAWSSDIYHICSISPQDSRLNVFLIIFLRKYGKEPFYWQQCPDLFHSLWLKTPVWSTLGAGDEAVTPLWVESGEWGKEGANCCSFEWFLHCSLRMYSSKEGVKGGAGGWKCSRKWSKYQESLDVDRWRRLCSLSEPWVSERTNVSSRKVTENYYYSFPLTLLVGLFWPGGVTCCFRWFVISSFSV